MRRKSLVEFSKEGKDFCFVFVDGSKSENYQSKEVGFKALVGFAKSKKITFAEFWEMREKIFPEGVVLLKEHGIKIIATCVGFNFAFVHPVSISDVEIWESYNDEKVEIATLVLCKCGEIHGQIYFRGGCTDFFDSKNEAIGFLFYLKSAGYVTSEELAKVEKEIENSGLV